MQNKANFRNVQMTVSLVKTMTNNNEPPTMNYSKQSQNKAKTKPIKANLLDAQMNVTSFITKDYENERFCRRGENKPNQTQKTHKHSIQAMV
jgi:hypothetical protein